MRSKIESFIQHMKKTDEYARHGFDILSKRPDAEEFFDILSKEGFFEPENNRGPVGTKQPGFVQIPFWPALNYLLAVAKRAGVTDDQSLAQKVLSVSRAVTNFRDSDDTHRDNYHTFRIFAEILGEVPLCSIAVDDVKLVRVWLKSRYDRGLVGSALSTGLFPRLLGSDDNESLELVLELMRACVGFEWRESGSQSGNLITYMDNYWLQQLLDSHALSFGKKVGYPGVSIFEDGCREIFSDPRRAPLSNIWRPAIEPNDQNMDFREVESRFVDGFRDALAGWISTFSTDSVKYVGEALTDSSEIIRRVAIHTTTENFSLLKKEFERLLDQTFFTSPLRHEMYRLLELRFEGLSFKGKQKVLESIRSLPLPKTGENGTQRLKYIQREWLSSIKNHSEAVKWFRELSNEPGLGSPTEHPDYLMYAETRYGPGPAPYGEEALVVFAEDGTLVDRINQFVEVDTWKGPTLEGLIAALEAAVASSPQAFLPILFDFRRVKIAFQHAVIAGLKRLHGQKIDQKIEIDWPTTWPKLLEYFSRCVHDEAFWQSEPDSVDQIMVPDRNWMVSLMADFLEAGTRRDEEAYPSELLPRGWAIIEILLKNTSSGPPNTEDPMFRALNSTKGRVISALYNHALRTFRVARRKDIHANPWPNFQNAFDLEIAQKGNFDFLILSASHVANLNFMCPGWLSDQVERLFPKSHAVAFQCAIGGLIYATPTRQIYKLLASRGILISALDAKLENKNSRNRILEWICLAYLWGDEAVSSQSMQKIFLGGHKDLERAAQFFWQIRSGDLSNFQKNLIVDFWEKAVEWSKQQTESCETLYSKLARLVCNFETLGEPEFRLLLQVVADAHVDYGGDDMIEELDRLLETSPSHTLALLEKMFEKNTPQYDFNSKLSHLLKKLHDMGYRSQVLLLIDRLHLTLPSMFELYKQLRTASNVEQVIELKN